MSEMIPPWHRPAAVCAGGGGSRSTMARANHWKRWDAKPEAKGRSSPYARSVAIGKPAETLGRKARGYGAPPCLGSATLDRLQSANQRKRWARKA